MAKLTTEQKGALMTGIETVNKPELFFNEASRMYMVTDETGMPHQVGIFTEKGDKIVLITLVAASNLPVAADTKWKWATQSPDTVGYSAISPENIKVTRKATVLGDGSFGLDFRFENKGEEAVTIPSFSQAILLASPAGLRTTPRLTNEGEIISTGAEAMMADRTLATLAEESDPTEFPYAGEVMIDLLGLPDDRSGYLLKVGGFDHYNWTSGHPKPDDHTTIVPLTLISAKHTISPGGVELVNFQLQRVSKIDRDRLASGQNPFSDYS